MSQIYIPNNAVSLENIKQTQIRMLIQGAPGTGKTYSSITFPNPIILDFDNKIGAHLGKKDIYRINFCDAKEYGKYANLKKDAIIKFLSTEGKKMSIEQTLIIDSWTALQDAYDTEAPVVYSTKTGKEDWQSWFGYKLEWNRDLCNLLKEVPCNILVLCHEQIERDEDSRPTGKVKPHTQGQFADKIGAYFTDVFRQIAVDKPKDISQVKLEYFKMSADEYKKFVDSFNTPTMYMWQTAPDNIANCLCSRPNFPRFIKADYNEYIKYSSK